MGTTYKCLIVDDEKPAHQVLTSHIGKCDDLICIGNVYNGKEALLFLQNTPVDILFLDINMPMITGMELLSLLPQKPVTIITTAYTDFALQSYENDVIDYLLKPIPFGKFLKAVEKAKVFSNNQKDSYLLPNTIEIKEDGIDYNVSIDSIIYIESAGNYIKVFTSERRKSYFVYGSLIGIKNELSEEFIQIHRSYLINVRYIETILPFKVILKTNIELPVGRKYQILLDKYI